MSINYGTPNGPFYKNGFKKKIKSRSSHKVFTKVSRLDNSLGTLVFTVNGINDQNATMYLHTPPIRLKNIFSNHQFWLQITLVIILSLLGPQMLMFLIFIIKHIVRKKNEWLKN